MDVKAEDGAQIGIRATSGTAVAIGDVWMPTGNVFDLTLGIAKSLPRHQQDPQDPTNSDSDSDLGLGADLNSEETNDLASADRAAAVAGTPGLCLGRLERHQYRLQLHKVYLSVSK